MRRDTSTTVHIELLSSVAQQFALGLENARLLSELARMATMDEMTDLANRRSFIEILGDWVGQASLKDESLSVILLDMDRLKRNQRIRTATRLEMRPSSTSRPRCARGAATRSCRLVSAAKSSRWPCEASASTPATRWPKGSGADSGIPSCREWESCPPRLGSRRFRSTGRHPPSCSRRPTDASTRPRMVAATRCAPARCLRRSLRRRPEPGEQAETPS